MSLLMPIHLKKASVNVSCR